MRFQVFGIGSPVRAGQLVVAIASLLFTGLAAMAQSAALAYQGRLTEAGAPATGTFAMQFRLYDTPEVGTGVRQGAEIEIPEVAVADGTFTALLDFGVAVFSGPPRFLEIGVRRANGTEGWNTLSPRQAITPVPYAIRTLSATPLSDAVFADGSGNVAIGTNGVPPGVRLNVAGTTRIAPGGTGGAVQFGTPNGETGMTVSGTNRFDLRFGRDTMTLAAGSNAGPPPPWNGLTLNTNGNVGIGLAELAASSLWKLEINGTTRITPVGNAGGAIQFSTPDGETGMTLLGRNRADLRFDDATVKLVAGAGNGAPGDANGLSIDLSGRVGIGTGSPTHRLSVAGDASVADRLQVGPVLVPSARLEVLGDTKPAIRAESIERDTPALIASGRTHGRALHADGHVTQELGAGGFVKAMVVLRAEKILRCFSGVGTPLKAPELADGDCGITVARFEADEYTTWAYIDFGFQVTDRFIVATPTLASQRMVAANVFFAPRGNTHEIALVVAMVDGGTRGDDGYLPVTVVVF